MSPRSFDPDVVSHRLAQIRRLLEFLEGADTSAVSLRRDLGNGLAVQRALQVIVDMAVKVNLHVIVSHGGQAPREYRDSFLPLVSLGILDHDLAMQLESSAGLRNVLVHEYIAIDHDVVASSCVDAIDQYGAYVDQIAVWLRARQDTPDV